MMLNTIILIDDRKNKKQLLIDEFNKYMKYSYTKIEALFKTLIENFPDKYGKEQKENLYIFLMSFLKKLELKEDISVIDIDCLSIENTREIIKKNENVIAIYLNKIENESRIFSIDIEKDIIVKEQIKELIKMIKG